MKKILLSSIIMLGVFGAVNAQDATGSKVKKNNQATISTAAAAATPALTPQKSTIAVQTEDLNTSATPKTSADKEAAAQAPTQIKTKKIQTQAATTSAVNAEGVVVTDEEKEKALKAEQEKATGAKEKKNQQ